MPSDTAAALRGFGPLGILAIVLILAAGNLPIGGVLVVPAGGLLVLLWVRLSGTPWREIGYVRPKSWTWDMLLGLAFGCALKLVTKAVVMPLLGADPVNHAYHALAGNTAMLPFAVSAMLAAGFGEETAFRGFLFERLGKLLGSGAGAKTTIVLATTALFALLHYQDQGLAGVEQATVTGLTFGTIYALTGRLWLLMCAHAAYDLAALAIIYANLEPNVAHLIFK
jgi:membrane protease YdiL (CAAX protease family)